MVDYAYRRIAADLEQQIRDGRIPPGGKLPGELELADMHGVSAGTVRRAVRQLRERGLVETLPHLGTFVVDPVPEA